MGLAIASVIKRANLVSDSISPKNENLVSDSISQKSENLVSDSISQKNEILVSDSISFWELTPETWDLRAETWNLRPPNGPPVGPPNKISQKVKTSYFRHSETFAPSKLIIFHQGLRFSRSRGPETAKKTNLTPLASQRLKLLPILFFLHVEAVQIYQKLP